MGVDAERLERSARVLVDQLLVLQEAERLLIYTDQEEDTAWLEVLIEQAAQRGARSEVLVLDPVQCLEDQSRQLVKRIEQGVDVICEFSKRYFYLTSSWQVAERAGVRAYSLAGMDSEAFIRCVGEVDHDAMFEFGEALTGRLGEIKSLRVFSGNGTDLAMAVKPGTLRRIVNKALKRPRLRLEHLEGRLGNGSRSTFLGGQLAWHGSPVPLNGVAVVDGRIWPPDELGDLETPLILTIKEGSVIDIDGCPEKVSILSDWFRGMPRAIQHLCFGFHPGAKMAGQILEAERCFGSITLGIGEGSLHTDGVIRAPSVEVDGNRFLDAGVYRHVPGKRGSLLNEL